MSELKFGFLGCLAIGLMFFPAPFGWAYGYKALPLAIVCLALSCLIIRKLMKETEGK